MKDDYKKAAEEYANTLHGEWELEYESDEWTACFGDFLAGVLSLAPALEAAEKRIKELEVDLEICRKVIESNWKNSMEKIYER